MKKIIFLFALLAVCFFPTQAFADRIQSYIVLIQINADSTIHVEERIIYEFDSPKHGIYRDIPFKYRRDGFRYNMDISDIYVSSEDYLMPMMFSTSTEGDNVRIKIGDPNQTVSGKQTYYITYDVDGALNFFDDHDELYWNAIGNNWDVSILGSIVQVEPPPGATENVNRDCFVGPMGSTTPCRSTINDENKIQFYNEQLALSEGVTVVVGWPKGFVTEPSAFKRIANFLLDNVFFSLPFIGLIVMLYVWHRAGRDPISKIPITAQYEPPPGLTPIEAGFLLDEHNQPNEVTAEIIYLATLGYLKIERIPKQGWLGKDDFKLIKLKDEKDLPNSFDRNLMRTLFVLGPPEVLLSSLRKKLKITRDTFALHNVGKELTKLGYYDKDPQKVKSIYMGVGGFILFSVFYFFGNFGLPTAVPIVLLGAVIMVVGYFMPRKTPKGADTKQLILGLKEY